MIDNSDVRINYQLLCRMLENRTTHIPVKTDRSSLRLRSSSIPNPRTPLPIWRRWLRITVRSTN